MIEGTLGEERLDEMMRWLGFRRWIVLEGHKSLMTLNFGEDDVLFQIC